MEPEEFHKLMRQAAGMARRHRPTWLDTQDLMQAAELAILEAKHKGRAETITDPAHLANKTRKRMWGAMMDAIRQALDGTRNHYVAAPEPLKTDTEGMPFDMRAAIDNPERTVQLKRAVERFARKGTARQQEAITLTAAGYSDTEIGLIMGISESRVSQLKKAAREIMSLWGDL